MEKVYIVGAKRTPIGSFLGSLKDVSAGDLGSIAIKAALEESKVHLNDVDEVLMGNVLSAGQGQGIARQTAIKAGLGVRVPATALNIACGSGMKAVMNAVQAIRAEDAHVIVAGGVESMSQTPHLIPGRNRSGHKMGSFEVVDHMLHDGLTDAFEGYHMGVTAENIVEKYQITREEQDQFAFESQQKAIAAVDAGKFKAEIAAVEVTNRKGTVVVDQDEYPNRQTNLDKLAKLRPAFKKDGSVTAGNASGINDGASATVVVSESYLKNHNLQPLVEIVAVAQAGVDPSVMGLGPTPAVEKVLEKAQLTLADVDVIELNEAFASQALGVIHELSERCAIDKTELMAKTNLNGGAIALGHPIGASGNRIIVTLIHLMKEKKAKYGLATLCIGGGMGTAIILKNPTID